MVQRGRLKLLNEFARRLAQCSFGGARLRHAGFGYPRGRNSRNHHLSRPWHVSRAQCSIDCGWTGARAHETLESSRDCAALSLAELGCGGRGSRSFSSIDNSCRIVAKPKVNCGQDRNEFSSETDAPLPRTEAVPRSKQSSSIRAK